MKRALVLKDFKFVVMDRKKDYGYYSFKRGNFEICLIKNSRWLICLANKSEEVLDEVKVRREEDALMIANEYYRDPNVRFDVI